MADVFRIRTLDVDCAVRTPRRNHVKHVVWSSGRPWLSLPPLWSSIQNGRHVGLDFYDLLIEGGNTRAMHRATESSGRIWGTGCVSIHSV